MQDPRAGMETPCIKLCALDGTRTICKGCYRTLDEIRDWQILGPEGRRAIMDALPARRKRLSLS